MIRTLIVDDDPAVVRLHTAYLSQLEGFSLVGAVGTGAAGARLAADANVDLVLLDMNLPDFSGIEVLHRLRAVREWGVDVLVISSARDSFTVRQALAAHVVGYLVKPFTKEAFLARLSAYRDARAERGAERTATLGQGEIDGLVRGRRADAAARGTDASGRSMAAAGSATHPADGSMAAAGRAMDAAGRSTDAAGVAPRAAAAAPASTPLPKGLAESTMTTVLDALDTIAPRSVAEVASSSGASRATVRRYLDHLVRTGAVDTSHRFGARGRPEVLYRRAPR